MVSPEFWAKRETSPPEPGCRPPMNDLGGHLTEPPLVQGTNVRITRRSLSRCLSKRFRYPLRLALGLNLARCPSGVCEDPHSSGPFVALPVTFPDHDDGVANTNLQVLTNDEHFWQLNVISP